MSASLQVTSSNGFQVCNSPLNTSKAKFMYSFPKDRRFRSIESLKSANMFYDLPSQRMTRTSALGYGSKYDFTKSAAKTPAPNTYDQKVMTISGEHDKRGWSFGLSRENMTRTSGPLGNLNLFSPGPGTYQMQNALSKQAYTLRQKTSSPDAKHTYMKSPGPGTYEDTPAITVNGRYFLSKYKSYGSPSFNPQSSSRFPISTKQAVPGPGSYQQPQSISNDGKYFLSRYKSSNSRTFPHSQRKFEVAGNPTSPGPGSYRLPSDFGYYEARNKLKSAK